MAIGFGFSVSDLCMGLKLIKESAEALDDKKGAASDYGGLLTEVGSLQEGLATVEELLQNDNLPKRQHVALERLVCECHKSIEEFIESISKYQPHLRYGTKGIVPKFRKMQWALSRKEDVAKFRLLLGRHASAINMLLITLQAKQSLVSKASHKNTIARIDSEAHLTNMMQTMSVEQRQSLLFLTQQNRELLRTIQDMRHMLEAQTRVPPQILLQQPVVLLDPLGKIAPFHLEFIDSPECFMAVLHARFVQAGVGRGGLSRLVNREFAIEDSQRKRQLDLDKPWSQVFRPGQQVDMRMIFHRFACPPSTCPSCLEMNDEDIEEIEEIECYNCGLFYQNFQAISKSSRDWNSNLPNGQGMDLHGGQIPYILQRPSKEPELKAFRPPEEAEDPLFEGFRRIQLVSQPLALLDPLFPALQLIEDFTHFADLLDDVPAEISPYRAEINILHRRARDFIQERDSGFPAFSSFSQIEQTRRRLTIESLTLRHYIDLLIKQLCNDPETTELVKYMKKKPPTARPSGYYAGALSVMVHLSEAAKTKDSKIPRPISKTKMDWQMLDSKPRLGRVDNVYQINSRRKPR